MMESAEQNDLDLGFSLSDINFSDIYMGHDGHNSPLVSSQIIDVDKSPDSTIPCIISRASEYNGETKRGQPETINTPGDVNFCVVVNSADVQKKKFLYSYKLNRIYVDVNCNFSLTFHWDEDLAPEYMYVRSTVVFSEAEQWTKRVERCVQHFYESPGLPINMAKNVMHSTSEIGSEGVYYCGDANVPDSWFSVVVRYKKTSSEPCTHAYKFTCKSSCPSGINRRPISIIFTLEDSKGIVYGRQTVGVKVCACLRRDMHKDENEEVFESGKKRAISNRAPQRKTKKIKMETRDIEHNMAMLPNIAVETSAMASGLRTMIDAMTIAGQHNPDVVEKYAPSIAELTTFINSLDKAPTTQ